MYGYNGYIIEYYNPLSNCMAKYSYDELDLKREHNINIRSQETVIAFIRSYYERHGNVIFTIRYTDGFILYNNVENALKRLEQMSSSLEEVVKTYRNSLNKSDNFQVRDPNDILIDLS